MRDTTFRPARPDDAEPLTELALAAKRHWGYAEELIALWLPDLRFTPQTIAEQTVVVAERDGRLVGVCALSQSGDAADLEGLWVHPSQHRRGLGRALFERAVDEARALRADALVIESDPHAERFYLRMGAAPAGTVAARPAGRRLPRLVYAIV